MTIATGQKWYVASMKSEHFQMRIDAALRQEAAERGEKLRLAEHQRDIFEAQNYIGIYAIGPALKGPVKIGISNDLPFRLGGLQTGCWLKLQPGYFGYFCATEGKEITDMHAIDRCAMTLERSCHERLRAEGKGLIGEWFEMSMVEAAHTIEDAAERLKMARLTVRRVQEITGLRTVSTKPATRPELFVYGMARNFKALRMGVETLKATCT